MFAGISVIAGPAKCGKTEQLLDFYRRSLADAPPGSALWLAPTVRSAAEIRARLLNAELPACFSPNVLTFDQFVQAILEASPAPMRRISRLMRRSILRSLIQNAAQTGRLKYFQSLAESPGLVDMVAGWISELKRLEIWPEDFLKACRQRGLTDKDRELAGLYTAYQDLLLKHNLFDAEGCFWSARTLLKEGQRRPFERLQTVVLDGFTDFTRTQHEMLEILASRAASLVVSLPLDPATGREDVFAKPLKTLARLQAAHPSLTLHEVGRPKKPQWSAMAHLEQQLFQNPARFKPAGKAAGIEILAASGQLNEIELLAQRIKRLLVVGEAGQLPAKPAEILVLFRSLEPTAQLVREVFAQHGVPVAIESPRMLRASAMLAALAALLRLDSENWPFRGLLAALGHNYLRPAWPEWEAGRAITAAEHLIRQSQIPSGREELLAQLKRWAAQLRSEANPGDGKQPHPRRLLRAQQASLAWPLLSRLGRALEALPGRASARQWIAALETLARELGMLRDDLAADDPDRLSWLRLSDALGGAERLAAWCPDVSAVWTRHEVEEQLTDILSNESLPDDRDELGRVRVLSAISARNLSAPYVFVAGLAEKSFPPPDRDERLYSEAETAGLIEAGLPFLARVDRSQEEMLLFYEALTRATRKLTLSYPALDDSAQPLSPSPFLIELERAFGLGVIERHVDLQLTPIPTSDEVSSERDWRVRGVAAALEGDAGVLAGFCRGAESGVAKNLLAALELTHQRQHGEGYGPFEGMVTSAAAQELLAKRFHPERTWSPSRLEQYAFCPYQFYLERVLGLEPLEDLSLEVDHLSRGRLLHGALATLHRRINARIGESGAPGDDDASLFLKDAEEILATLVEAPGGDRPLVGAMREIDRRLLTQWIAGYRDQHARYDAQWRDYDRPLRPTYFEASFGATQQEADDPEQPELEVTASDSLSTINPLKVISGGQQVYVSGRIDRIDVGVVAGQTVFNIVDYKSGSAARFSAKAVTEALALQLPLYALAVQELLLANAEAVPWRAAYWFVKAEGYKQALSFHSHAADRLLASPEWDVLREKLLARVISLVQGVRHGEFPMHSADDECTSHCAYRTVCRVGQTRSLEKTWTPPAVTSE